MIVAVHCRQGANKEHDALVHPLAKKPRSEDEKGCRRWDFGTQEVEEGGLRLLRWIKAETPVSKQPLLDMKTVIS